MKVTVKLIGPLIYEAGFSEKTLKLSGEVTAGELVGIVKVDKKRHVIITRNGHNAGTNEALKDGDRVVISHVYSGG